MRKIYLKDIHTSSELIRALDPSEHVSRIIVWENLLKFGDESDRVDLTFEVGQALSVAAKPYNGDQFEIYSVRGDFALNARLDDDFYGHASGKMDVWITVKAFHEFAGFYLIGFYLSDIWQLCSYEASWDECRDHMFIRHYVE